MSLLEYAVNEMKLAFNYPFCDEMQKEMCDGVLKVISVFSQQGHSGFSANYAISMLTLLLQYRPLTALSGEDNEWRDVHGNGIFQNKRLPTVFKQADRFEGQAYNAKGKEFSDNGGEIWFTCIDSHIPIEFPYVYKESEKVILDRSKEEQ
jgi:hypothetical protein